MDHQALLWLVPLAVALDLAVAFQRPPRRTCRRGVPHPVECIGRWLNLLEPRLRALAPSWTRTEGYLPDVLCDGEVRAGFVGALLTAGLCAAVATALTALPVVGILCAAYLCWSGLALGQLVRDGRAALDALECGRRKGNFEEGRRLVSMLTSRDLNRAGSADLYRALAESLAENFNDAFVAPLFWLTLGGPAGLWAYKALSTMDSMWGYRTPEWEGLGKTAARLDDAAAFVPARLAAFLLWATGLGASLPGAWPGVAVVRRQACLMAGPNAGWPMSAAAWLHGAPMGGPTVYHGEMVDKSRLGPGCDAAQDHGERFGPWDGSRVASLLHHLTVAGLAAGLLALLGLWAAHVL